MKGDEVKRLIMIPIFLAGALALAGCAAQSQEPRVDDSSGSADQPKTVVFKDDNDAVTGQDDSSTGQGGNPRDGGNMLVEDDPDGMDDLDADDNMRSEGRLPADFPIPVPDRYRVEAVGEVGNESAVILRVPSGEDAYNYYRQDLADEGFRVVDEGRNQGGFFDAELEFSNDELEGNLDFDGDRVEIDLERY
jgi:hypothetical protein